MVDTGPKRLIIDTGQSIPEWADLVSCTLATESASLSHVLLTHWHDDHVGGVPSLVGLYSHLNGAIYKHSPCEDQQPITDRQVFHVEGASLRAVHSPDHSHDHMCFVLAEEGAMFTGDNVLGHDSGVYKHLGSWMATLRAMQKYDCAVGYPAHEDVIADLPAKIAGELAQKERRERQILLALAQSRQSEQKGNLTIRQLVAEMHGSRLNSQMQEFALVPFYNETLQKLARDGNMLRPTPYEHMEIQPTM